MLPSELQDDCRRPVGETEPSKDTFNHWTPQQGLRCVSLASAELKIEPALRCSRWGSSRGNGPAPVLFPILVANHVIYLTQSGEEGKESAFQGKPVFMTRKIQAREAEHERELERMATFEPAGGRAISWRKV